ncbi:hypothetical protein EXIGLDRAFT_795979 [Exidia glandulosa HHB12029]|uniref:Uncharacterized protein n=1 Tax=Exidia glandulosa HHB12029 TaxID=1314781 RepID=A0A165NAZ3_EXIGL|nr:hypothetical protein EXIGLDRAFT_795979 [Exidia glandulosa HHB12029]
MPNHILKKFQKLATDFFWSFSPSHTVNEATTALPQSQGGMNILDLKARNDAIYLTWASKYLEPSTSRPMWAYVADAILKATVNKDWKQRFSEKPEAMSNQYLQDWWPTVNDLPLELKLMVKATVDYGVKLDGAYIDEDVRNALPIWYHLDRITGPKENHKSRVISCLRCKHEVFTVGEAVVCGFNQFEGDRHNRRSNCACPRCRADRALGCTHPYLCQEYAQDLTVSIGAKWSPMANDRDTTGDLDEEAKAENERALTTWEPVTFDATIEAPKTVHETFRVFTNSLAIAPDNDELSQPGTHDNFITEGRELTFAACGNAIHANTARARSGYAIVCREMGIVTSGTHNGPQTKVRAATVAILEAARAAPKDVPLLIMTNSKRAVQRLTTQRQKLETNGWRECRDDANVLRTTIATLRSRSARTRIVAVDEELDVDERVRRAACRARRAAKKDEPQMNDLRGPQDFDIPGIPLHALKQRTAYQHIRDAKAAATMPRRPTTTNLDRVRESVAETRAKKPTDQAIWRALMQRPFSTEVRVFLWRCLHEGHKTGEYFTRMKKEEHQLRGYCTICGDQVVDSLEHILLECNDPAREQVWELAKAFWAHKHGKWFELSYGLILGCGLVTIRDQETHRKLAGATRLFRILISESAYLIWKLRCTRRIDHADDVDWRQPADLVRNEWFRIMTDRLHTDCLLTSKARHGRRALPKGLVISTWAGVLETVHDLPELMLKDPGFLVGNTRRQQPRSSRTARESQRG